MKEEINKKRERITENMVKKEINKMKRKKAGDRLGWKAEWIKEGGKEMAKSLAVLFNRIEEEGEISKLWQLTTIKSVRKKGNQDKLSESQRGLFMVNVVSKVYERVKKTQNEKIHKNMNQMQCVGRTQRSTMDNIIIMSAIVEKRRTERLNTYLFFADAVKCFDKLWLKDCLIELKTLGYKHNDLKILYEMNKRSIVTINTPFGETGNIEIEEIVKQGTTY